MLTICWRASEQNLGLLCPIFNLSPNWFFSMDADNVGVGLVVTKNAWENIFLYNFITKVTQSARFCCHFFFFILVYINILQHDRSDDNHYQLHIQANTQTHPYIHSMQFTLFHAFHCTHNIIYISL